MKQVTGFYPRVHVDAAGSGVVCQAGGVTLADAVRVSGIARDPTHVARLGGRFLVPGDPQWPAGVEDFGPRRPVGLWVCGALDLRAVTGRSVAVIGARASTGYGDHVAGEISAALARRRRAVALC